MDNAVLAFLSVNILWYALPLVVAVSLVYAATRHEKLEPILGHAVRVGAWIVGFMAIVFVILVALSWWLTRST